MAERSTSRVALHRERLRAKGWKQINIEVPEEHAAAMRSLASYLRDHPAGELPDTDELSRVTADRDALARDVEQLRARRRRDRARVWRVLRSGKEWRQRAHKLHRGYVSKKQAAQEAAEKAAEAQKARDAALERVGRLQADLDAERASYDHALEHDAQLRQAVRAPGWKAALARWLLGLQ